MYNAQEQTNADIHAALATIADVVGGGYRPKAIVSGYLGARTLEYLAESEDIHVAQATVFSQFNIDFGDGDGGSPYPYLPSKTHYLRPAQTSKEAVDLVALDGWVCAHDTSHTTNTTTAPSSDGGLPGGAAKWFR